MGRFLASVVLVHVRSDTRHFVEIGPCSFRSMVRAVEGLLEVSAVDGVIDDLADMHVDGSLDLHDVVELDCELVGFADAELYKKHKRQMSGMAVKTCSI